MSSIKPSKPSRSTNVADNNSPAFATAVAITIGRAGCAVNLGDDPFLSQAHAEILVDGQGQARLKDLGSSNGTFARLPPNGERELRDADVVRLGREVLRVQVIEG